MSPIPIAAVASRFLEPLTHPWAVIGGGVLGGGAASGDAALIVVRLALRLIRLLLVL